MSLMKELGQYNRVNVETAGRLELVLMCYDKCIELLRQARQFLEQGDYEKKAGKLQKAFDIIHQLQSCLDFEKGGQIAKNLDSLYTYIVKRLLQGDIQKDTTTYEEAIRILTELRGAWKEIASRSNMKINPGEQALPRRISLESIAA